MLAPQGFVGGLLTRGIGKRQLEALWQSGRARVLLVSGRQVLCTDGTSRALRWLDPLALSALQLEWACADELAYRPGPRAPPVAVPLLYLGASAPEPAGDVRLAADVSDVAADLRAALEKPGSGSGGSFADLRSLLSVLPAAELAAAGHAVAIAGWHLSHRYCGRCGSPTVPIEGGAKRQCVADRTHRVYPRTDPVAIALVESPDGERALLGCSRQARPGCLSCLSGFVDQGESVEEAVRREVAEEAGVPVGPVTLLGSQPWPIGRAGGCELMVGCIAQAQGERIVLNEEEMLDARWVTRAQALEALGRSASPENPYNGGAGGSGAEWWVPPPFAIAHGIIGAWARRPGRWFPPAASL